MKSICFFAIHPCCYITETPFISYDIHRERIVLGYKIVFQRVNRYTCFNTCKILFMSMLSTSAHFKFFQCIIKAWDPKANFSVKLKKMEEKYIKK